MKKLEEMSREELERALERCRNELCLVCGRYTKMHLGVCDGCIWKNFEGRKK